MMISENKTSSWTAMSAWLGMEAQEDAQAREEIAAAEKAADAVVDQVEEERAAIQHDAFDGCFTCGKHAREFILAGNARFTLVSRKTGQRFTFRARAGKDNNAPTFVALLTGPDNGQDFEFLGTIFADGNYRHGKKSRIGMAAPGARAFAWAWGYLAKGQIPPACEVWHEGKCGRCARALTVPESVARGLGPECAGKAA